MKTAKLLLFFSLFGSLAYAEPYPVGPYNFLKGLNVQTIASDIDPSESPDLCNCVPTLNGAATKRNGSTRLISQSISSFPVTALYRAYASTVTQVFKNTIAASNDKIIISTDDLNPKWITISSGNVAKQHYSFVTMNRKVIMAGDAQTENPKQYDIVNSSLTSLFTNSVETGSIIIRPKFQIVSKNYYIAANVSISTSFTPLIFNYYPSRIVYSILNNASSMTAQRYIDFKTEDGEEITGIGAISDHVDFFKPSSISDIQWTNALNLPSAGGDWVFTEVVTGFGCIAPRTLANTGQEFIFLSKEGIRTWDGGHRTLLDSTQTSQVISIKIKPIIDDLIKSGRYKSAVGIFYPKKRWYVFSYENQSKFPNGANNSVLIYDFNTGEWFPFCNWLADSFTIADNAGDNGQLYYGDSMDGYVHLADLDTKVDDSRKELSIDVMDSSYTWTGSTQDTINVLEGSASLKIGVANNFISASSMTSLGVFNLGEWPDKSKASKADYLHFNAFPVNLSSISYLRVDLEVNLGTTTFDTNFTSVTLTSANFSGGESAWSTFDIALSSFPIRKDWTNLSAEIIPFANSPTFYGIRFVLGGVAFSSCSIDDLRFVQSTENPNKMYRFTKLFDMNGSNYKGFGSVRLVRDKYADSAFNIDIYNDFGQVIRTANATAEIPKEIFVTGFFSNNNISVLNAIDFTLKRQTATAETFWSAFNGSLGRKYLFFPDRTHDRIIKMDRNNFNSFISSYGSIGNGTTNFNLMAQNAIDENDNFFQADMNNERLKTHSQNSLAFKSMAGSLGTGNTSYNDISAVTANNANVYTNDEGNGRINKLDKSTDGIVAQVSTDYNTLANASLGIDERYVYHAYNKVSDRANYLQDVILEKRDAGDLGLINRVRITPFGSVDYSTYNIMGEIGLLGKYIFIIFTDSIQELGANYYLQKRLKSDFSIVSELKTKNIMYSVIGDGLSFKPALSSELYDLKSGGTYIQLKFYDDPNVPLDNSWKLYNMTFLVNPTPLTY